MFSIWIIHPERNTAGLYSTFIWDVMESQLRKASSAGILLNNVIRVILHSEFRTKGKMSVENTVKPAGTVMDTLFCAVGSVGSLELPLATAWISQRGINSTGNTPPSAEDTQTEECLHADHIQLGRHRIYFKKNWIGMITNQIPPCFFKTPEP